MLPNDPTTEQLIVEELRQHQWELRQQNEELRHAQEELNRINEYFRELWDDAPVGYVQHEWTGAITAANRRATMLLSKVRQMESAAMLQSFMTPQSRFIFRQHMIDVAARQSCDLNQPVAVAEFQLETSPSEPALWIRTESTATANSEYRSALIDISVQKKAEQELLQTQKMDVLHNLSGGIAHDFNNILQVVSAYSCLIEAELKSRGGDVSLAEALLDGVEQGSELTERLLAFSRKSSLQNIATDIRKTIRHSATIARRTVGDHITVSQQIHDEPLICLIDSNLIHQAVLNLCLNARDAMPNGGTLFLGIEKTRAELPTREDGELLEPGDYACITVSDSGVGMSSEVKQRIFEPFFTTKGSGSGTGLGLSIVHGSIKQHGGTIRIESAPGEGTKFKLYIPLSGELIDPVQRSTAQPGSSSHFSGTVLFAEDEPAIRRAITRLLTTAGLEVVIAHDGKDALNRIAAGERFDLLLTDMMMPVASGRVICEALHKRTPETPVILLTGHGNGVIDSDFLVEHNVQLLRKPLSNELLLQSVAACLTHGDRSP